MRVLIPTGKIIRGVSGWLRSAFFLVWIIVAAELREAAGAEPVRLSGAFIQFVQGMETWGMDKWQPVLEHMRDARITTIIIQMTAFQKTDGTFYYYVPSGTGTRDGIARIFEYANTNHMEVMLGLVVHNNNGGDSSTSASFLTQAAADNLQVANRVWERYLKNGLPASFAGWYIPLETWTGSYSDGEIARLRSFFSQVSAECKKLSGPAPVAISPFISAERPPASEAGQIYARLLTGSGIDIVMLQDSVGAQRWDANVMSNTEPYFREFRKACDQAKVSFWANVESFQISGGNFQPCTFERMRRQLSSDWRHVDRMITFDFFHYMNAAVYLSWWNASYIAAMTNLYTAYKSNVVDRDFYPEPPLALQAISKSQDAVVLSWSGQKGKLFGVDYVSNLSSTQWTQLVTGMAGDESVWSYWDVAGQWPNRFYRLSQSPPFSVPENLVWIPAGTFLMGSPDAETNRRTNEGPQTRVTLDYGFWINRFEVTQAEYQNVCRNNPSQNTGDLSLPVDSVTWNQASNYCAKLNEIESQAGRLPAGYQYRLPTEAEWEYAARAGTTTAYYFGNSTNAFETFGWYRANSEATPHAIGLKTPNAWGLYDLSGNLMEWCGDALEAYPGGAVTNIQGSAQSQTRTVRGGGWDRPVVQGRSAWRESHLPALKYADIGFRVVLVPVAP
jgi:formylglycine-generating enzyme required for sulfatase activity